MLAGTAGTKQWSSKKVIVSLLQIHYIKKKVEKYVPRNILSVQIGTMEFAVFL